MIVTFICNRFELCIHEIHGILFRREKSWSLIEHSSVDDSRYERLKGGSAGDPSSHLKDNDSAAGAEENGLPEKASLAQDYHENKDPLSAVSKYDRTFVQTARFGLSRRPENVPFKEETAVPSPARLKNCTPWRTRLPL